MEKTDHILIFFTDNAKKIDMNEIADHGSAELDMIKVSAGKQSTDIHIGSYLGYLEGKNTGKDVRIIIVSKDSDFDNVIEFWKTRSDVKASRVQKIIDAVGKKTVQQKQPNAEKQAAAKAVSKKLDSAERMRLNNAIMKTLSTAKYNGETVGKAASIVLSHLGEKDISAVVKKELKKKFADPRIYTLIAPIIAVYDDTADKSAVNMEIRQILAQAGKPNEITGHVTSLVVKNMGVKNGKQMIYRAIIQKYGQKEGLDIYNRIKKHIPS